MPFSNSLTNWYLQNKRDLPWRNTQNPYFIWLSEIMLQQTRVAQGMAYYLTFTTVFPTVFDLANASEEQVLKLWQGLGYYSRARNLHKTAQHIVNDLNGIFPDNYESLLKLKGVGEYTAAAIASFSFNEAVPVVDGNVFRVLSRYFDIETDIAISSTRKEFFELASELILKKQPALFNQAIMDFGALQCIPKKPNCNTCVLNNSCLALQKNKIDKLPIKTKKAKAINRYFNYLIFNDEKGNTIIQKRINKGIWHNLYEFPLIEVEQSDQVEAILGQIKNQHFVINPIIEIEQLNTKNKIIHKLTHQHLHIQFWKIQVKGILKQGIDYKTLLSYPFPIVIFNFIEKELN